MTCLLLQIQAAARLAMLEETASGLAAALGHLEDEVSTVRVEAAAAVDAAYEEAMEAAHMAARVAADEVTADTKAQAEVDISAARAEAMVAREAMSAARGEAAVARGWASTVRSSASCSSARGQEVKEVNAGVRRSSR